MKSRTLPRVGVASVDADADTIETVDVSPLPEDAISTTRPFLRSAKSVPKTPPGVTPPRIPHITRNQLDHKAAQAVGIRKSGVFFVLYGSPGCSFCQRFHGLLNAAVDDLDARAFASKTEPKRVFQIDCALNDCHARWNAEIAAAATAPPLRDDTQPSSNTTAHAVRARRTTARTTPSTYKPFFL